MVLVFQEEFSVPKECLEQYIGCKSEAFTENSIVRLRGVYTALKEGRADREDYFTMPTADAPEQEEKPQNKAPEQAPAPEQCNAPEVDNSTGEVVSIDDL
jgi:hypothetical protein